LAGAGLSWELVVADYDGDAKADIAVYNAIGVWSIERTSDEGNTAVDWGEQPKIYIVAVIIAEVRVLEIYKET